MNDKNHHNSNDQKNEDDNASDDSKHNCDKIIILRNAFAAFVCLKMNATMGPIVYPKVCELSGLGISSSSG